MTGEILCRRECSNYVILDNECKVAQRDKFPETRTYQDRVCPFPKEYTPRSESIEQALDNEIGREALREHLARERYEWKMEEKDKPAQKGLLRRIISCLLRKGDN